MRRMGESDRPRERRGGPRRRLRLHAARVADIDGRFLGEGAVSDASEGGARLRLTVEAALPAEVLIFDEGGRRLASAVVIWARGRDAGLRLGSWLALDDAPPALRRRLAAPYYATD